MSIILVPYHLDEHLPDLNIPLPLGVDVVTVVETLPEDGVWARLGHLYGAVAEAVARDVGAGGVPIVVSGDCTASLATVAGLQRVGVDASLVWFDAHGDVQTLETTTSGYVGGMPLRILVGYRPELISERLGLRALDEDRVVLVDARDLDPSEEEYLATARIRRHRVDDLALPDGPLVLHVDVDVVDAGELPGARFPSPDGPSVSAVLDAARRVLDTGQVVAVDVGCTWQPGGGDPTGARSLLLSGLTRGASGC